MASAKSLENAYLDREFPMSSRNFSDIKNLAYELTGIQLSDHKRNMIYSRLARRIRTLKLSDFDQYCDLLTQQNNAERNEFVNAITTNLTSFFRENHHFEFLKDKALPDIIHKHQKDKRVRGWSAGCSTGEEPYSIAIVMKELLSRPGWDAKLLASDLDSNVVDKAQSGIYGADRIESVVKPRKDKWFLQAKHDKEKIRVKPSLQEIISFKRLNLLEAWPMKGPFDFIFCRNVVIYFDKDTQRKLFDRYADILAPGGYLFIGHSESLHRVSDRFKSLGKTMYQRID